MIEWPIRELVPHAGDMILLDHVLDFDAESLTASASVRASGPFHDDDGSLPGWIAIEIMAQAVAAWAGCQARTEGRPVEQGFLLGTRQFNCDFPGLRAGMQLVVEARRCLQDDSGIGVFACRLSHEGALLAQARLNVYAPRNAAAFVQEPPAPSTPSSP